MDEEPSQPKLCNLGEGQICKQKSEKWKSSASRIIEQKTLVTEVLKYKYVLKYKQVLKYKLSFITTKACREAKRNEKAY